jgi:hypothetical protein
MSMPEGANIQEDAADKLPNNGGVNAEEEIEESEECVSIFEEAKGKHVDAEATLRIGRERFHLDVIHISQDHPSQ